MVFVAKEPAQLKPGLSVPSPKEKQHGFVGVLRNAALVAVAERPGGLAKRDDGCANVNPRLAFAVVRLIWIREGIARNKRYSYAQSSSTHQQKQKSHNKCHSVHRYYRYELKVPDGTGVSRPTNHRHASSSASEASNHRRATRCSLSKVVQVCHTIIIKY